MPVKMHQTTISPDDDHKLGGLRQLEPVPHEDEVAVRLERMRMALTEAGYPRAEVTWSEWMNSPQVTTWSVRTDIDHVPGLMVEQALMVCGETGPHGPWGSEGGTG